MGFSLDEAFGRRKDANQGMLVNLSGMPTAIQAEKTFGKELPQNRENLPRSIPVRIHFWDCVSGLKLNGVPL